STWTPSAVRRTGPGRRATASGPRRDFSASPSPSAAGTAPDPGPEPSRRAAGIAPTPERTRRSPERGSGARTGRGVRLGGTVRPPTGPGRSRRRGRPGSALPDALGDPVAELGVDVSPVLQRTLQNGLGNAVRQVPDHIRD